MIVRLKENVENIMSILIKKFQFYDSPIKRLLFALMSDTLISFNSMIVRLKELLISLPPTTSVVSIL